MEAITHGVTGWIADPEKTGEWVDAVRALTADSEKRIAVTRAARSWVETHFQAAINTGLLAARFRDLAR
jgi:glycosyltransferase involved in cell wall biosynthesis